MKKLLPASAHRLATPASRRHDPAEATTCGRSNRVPVNRGYWRRTAGTRGMRSGYDARHAATALAEPLFHSGDWGCVRTRAVTRISASA